MAKYVYWYNPNVMNGSPTKAIDDRGQKNEIGRPSQPVSDQLLRIGFRICPDQAAAEERYEKEYAQRLAEREQAESSNGAEGYYESDEVNATDGAIAYAKERNIPWHKIEGALEGKRITMFELKAFTGEQ